MIAPAVLPLVCGSCATFICPGEPYVVTPDVAGVGADQVACLRCGPDDSRLVCDECGEYVDLGDTIVHFGVRRRGRRMIEQLRQSYLEALIARASVEPASDLLDRIERLLGIAGSIEQPAQGSEASPASKGTPAPAPQPPSGVEAEGTLRTSASGEAVARITASPPRAPAATRPCQFCGKELAARGRPTHERWCEENPNRATPWTPAPTGLGGDGQPPASPSKESYVCDRCNEPFPSRQALSEHRRGHPEIPPTEPVRRAFRGPVDAVMGGGA